MEATLAKKSYFTPDTLAASVTILLVANLVQRSIGFGRGILFCRWLSPDELGTWDMAYSFLLLASPVVVLGLPGTFGRYLERYRQRGQLRTFLRRATLWTIGLTVFACGLMVYQAPWFSELIFGRPDPLVLALLNAAVSTAGLTTLGCGTISYDLPVLSGLFFDEREAKSLVVLLSLSLAAVILHHFLEALFAALRKFSIVSTMHFCQSMLFAAISLTLMWWWRFAAESIVIGYGAACLVSAIVMLAWKGRAILAEAAPDDGIAHLDFWPPLMRFAFWVWVINLFCHLFGIADRYMLVHWSGLDNAAALALVGQYHASRIIPILFLSLADLLAGAVMPYLSHDWESGARERVSERLNMVLKVTSLAMLAGGVVVMWTAPILFHLAFGDRYDEGLAVLPWTLTYCVWYSLLLVAQNYVWCAEKAKLAVLPLVGGLLVNIGADLLLIPAWGLLGAVVATTAATGVALGAIYWISGRAGMQLDRGMLLISLAPIAMCGGVWVGTAAVLILIAALPLSKTLVTASERALIAEFATTSLARFNAYRSQPTKTTEPKHAV